MPRHPQISSSPRTRSCVSTRPEFAAVEWAGLVLDEAQFVKNSQTKAYRAARDLRADVTFAITGTPMENSLTELWALLSLSAPGLFPSARRFREEYVGPIEQGKVPENQEGAPAARAAARPAATADPPARAAPHEGARRRRPAAQAGAGGAGRARRRAPRPLRRGAAARAAEGARACSTTSTATGSSSSARSRCCGC